MKDDLVIVVHAHLNWVVVDDEGFVLGASSVCAFLVGGLYIFVSSCGG